MINDFEIHIIEIEKAIKSLKENKQDKIAQWMSFFDNPNLYIKIIQNIDITPK